MLSVSSHELRLDVAPAALRAGCDPGIVLFGSDTALGAALFDSCGSWDNGQEAAAFVRTSLADAWSAQPPSTIDVAITDTLAAVDRVPPTLRADGFSYSFDGVLLLAQAGRVTVACAGAHGVQLCSDGVVNAVFAPRLLPPELADQSLTEEEQRQLEGLDVCFGPYLGGPVRDPFMRSEPVNLAAGDVLVVAYRRLLAELQRLPVAQWIHLSALELQALGVRAKRPAAPVIVLRR